MKKLEQVLDKFIALFLKALDSGFYHLYIEPKGGYNQFVKVYKDKEVVDLKPAPREQEEIEAVKDKLIMLHANQLPGCVPLNAKTSPWPPDKNTVRQWLLEEPLQSNIGSPDGSLQTKYSKPEDITSELVDEVWLTLKAFGKNKTKELLEKEKRYEALKEDLSVRLRKIRDRLEKQRKKSDIHLPEPFIFAYKETLYGYNAIGNYELLLDYISVAEKEFKENPQGCSSLKDYLAKKLRKQKEEYLQEWGKKGIVAKNKSYWKLISGVVKFIAFIASITSIIDFITNKIGFVRLIISFFKPGG